MLEIITDNRMSRNQSRYDLVFFRWNGAAYRFTELPAEIQCQADKVYPVTFEARQAASLAKRQAAEQGRAVDAPQAGA